MLWRHERKLANDNVLCYYLTTCEENQDLNLVPDLLGDWSSPLLQLSFLETITMPSHIMQCEKKNKSPHKNRCSRYEYGEKFVRIAALPTPSTIIVYVSN